MIAAYLRDQLNNPGGGSRFDALIAKDDPDLSGGLKFVKSQRHEVYLEAHALKSYLKQLRRKMGWPELSETYYDHLRTGAAARPSPAMRVAA
jgi:hypothetical protein